MKILDLTFPTPEENLACDEALLEEFEAGLEGEILRFWEPAQPFVVLGISSRHDSEVNRSRCRSDQIPILRRVSGGGTVLQGPGALNYALILRIRNPGPLATIGRTNRFILERHRRILESVLKKPVRIQGETDLTLDGRKFSGNSQRRKKTHLLFHGSFLFRLDMALMEKLLPIPDRRPDYRADRSHTEFLTHLDLPPSTLKQQLSSAWGAIEPLPLNGSLSDRIGRLVAIRYASDSWTFRL